jgi:enoyl-CoA hydratase/carnithine racemase
MILAPSTSKEARVVMLFESDRLRLESIDQIATIWLDTPAMDSALVTDLSHALGVVRKSSCIDLLVIRSSKPGIFLTGPNLNECARLRDEIALRDFSLYGQYLLERLERISETIPTVAYIDGRCTNAGLELALACNYRLAVARPETLLGCDPLARGWLPCWGATQRLPRLLGLRMAARLLTSGELLPARAARKLGLVDLAFGPRPAKAELNWFLADLQDHPEGRRPRSTAWWTRLWERTAWGQSSAFESLRKESANDPLAAELLRAMERGARFGPAEGYQAERGALVRTVHDGKHRERLEAAQTWEQQSAQLRDTPLPNHVAVVGLSETGIEWAMNALRFGARLTVRDNEAIRREAGLAHLRQLHEQAMRQGWWTHAEGEQKRKDLRVSAHGEGVEAADLVFLTGSAEEQRAFLAEMECFVPAETAIVSTPLNSFTRAKHPERCLPCRIHPVSSSRTIEFVGSLAASEAAIGKLVRWLDHCGHRGHGFPAVQHREEKVAVFAA